MSNQDQSLRWKSKSGNRQIPVGPDSVAGRQARSCILAVEGAEAVIERKREQLTDSIKEKGSEF